MLSLVRLVSLVFLILLSCLLGGCATLTNGTTQSIPVSSSPSGASVFADGQHVGTTPCTVELSRSASHVITLERDGYEGTAVHLTREISAMTAGNLIFGGLIGLGVDAVSGANFRLVPEQVNVSLQRCSTSLRRLEQRSPGLPPGAPDSLASADQRTRYSRPHD